ncbi:MAG: hypothetical protein QOE07_1840, partial [Acidimicrobiaceae bacterium]|nr:hypothetical protein [Acidimicrobiaceae bacterium]
MISPRPPSGTFSGRRKLAVVPAGLGRLGIDGRPAVARDLEADHSGTFRTGPKTPL